MSPLSRREFGKIAIAGIPLGLTAFTRAATGGVVIGVSTDSFRALPRVQGSDNVDEVVRAVRSLSVARIDLALANVEPAPPSTASFMGGSPAYPKRIVLTPEQILATNTAAREDLRRWRLQTGVQAAEAARTKLTAAGLTLESCSLAYDKSFTDEEIDITFAQAKTLGAGTISSPMTKATAARLVPFAERHQLTVAIHNQVDGNAGDAMGTAEFESALALSARFKLALDIGNLTASNCDAVAELRRYQPRVAQIVIKDRLRNGGTSQPFGEGDTPIAAVLNLLAASASPVTAMVEYDYIGLRPPVDEVKTSLAYLTRTLATR